MGLVDQCIPAAFLTEQRTLFVKKMASEKAQKHRRRKQGYKGVLERTMIGRFVFFKVAKRQVLKKTKGHYPAPLAIVSVLSKTMSGSRTKRMKKEAIGFSKLAPSSESKQLIRLFFLQEYFKKYTGVDEGHSLSNNLPKEPNVGVLGAGLMGGGMAWLFSNKGMSVRLKDIQWSFISDAFKTCFSIYNRRVKKRQLKPHELTQKMLKLSGTNSYKGFDKLSAVIEAIPENLDLKKTVLKELETHVSPSTILASNTSALSISEMATALSRPEKFIGIHFLVPCIACH